ncbi:MAG: addB [Firmicutes bacterium]|nr:addB [Bacillota bacterium]
MHNLYCSPLGETVRDKFAHSMADAGRYGAGQETVYLLPSIYLLKDVRKTLRMANDGHEQPKLMLFDDLVTEIVRAAGGRQRVMSRVNRQLMMEKVLEDLAACGRLPYFSSITSFPGYVGTVNALLTEIKRSGTLPEEFKVAAEAAAEARGWQDKDSEVFAIYALYQERLKEYGLADMEEMYFLAIEALMEGRWELPYRQLYISEFDILTPMQLEIVRQLRPLLKINIGIMYEKNRPGVFKAVEPTYAALVGAGFNPIFLPARRESTRSLKHVRNNLYSVGIDAGSTDGQIKVVYTPNPEKEMAVIVRQIKQMVLKNEFSLEDVVVVVREKGRYADFPRVCFDYNLPVDLESTECLATQPLFNMLTAMLEAKADGGSREMVLNVLKNPLVEAAFGIDAEAVEHRSLELVISGWTEWLELAGFLESDGAEVTAFCSLINSWPSSGWCEQWTAVLGTFLQKLNIPAKLGSDFRQGMLDLCALKAGLSAFKATEELMEELADDFLIGGQQDRLLSATEFLRYFRQAAAEKKLGGNERENGGVKIVTPAEARGVTCRATFVLGLADGEFPRRERDSWLYDERERGLFKDLGLELMTASFRRSEEDLYFAVAAAMAEEFLVISAMEDVETMPSPYVDEIRRLFLPETLAVERYTVSDIFPSDYQYIYAAKELAGRALCDSFGKKKTSFEARTMLKYVLTEIVDNDFMRRVVAEAERLGGGVSSYNGILTNNIAAATWKESFLGRYSISALEDYAVCPFNYFASRVLKLNEWEEKEEEAGGDVIGTVYHEVLATFLRSHLGIRLRNENIEQYYTELVAALDAVSNRLIKAKGIVSPKWWDYRRRHLMQALRRWLNFELMEENSEGLAFTPAWLEWGFGLPVTNDMDEASTVTPLTMMIDGNLIEVVGKVDRIDRAGDILVVVDYKRKNCPQFSALKQGTDLQAALYIMAVEQLLCSANKKVAGGGYYSVEGGKKDGGMWRSELAGEIRHRAKKNTGNLDGGEWLEMQDKVRHHVAEIVASIKTGRFFVRPAIECPEYCVAKEICRNRQGLAASETGDEVNG